MSWLTERRREALGCGLPLLGLVLFLGLLARERIGVFIDFGEEVDFEDPRLGSAARKKLGIDRDARILGRDLASLNELSIRQVRSLHGLEHCSSLRTARVQSAVDGIDLAPLAQLSELRELELTLESLRSQPDLSPLGKLTNLEVLVLSVSAWSSFTLDWHLQVPLEKLRNLRRLRVDGSFVKGVLPLTWLARLDRFDLRSTGPRGLVPIGEVGRMKSLTLELADLSVSEFVARASNLEDLTLRQCSGVTDDFAFLAGKAALRQLSLDGCRIGSVDRLVASLDESKKLRDLGLERNAIGDIRPLVKLEPVQSLSLRSNRITDVSPLLEMKDLGSVVLEDNPLDTRSTNVIRALRERGVEVHR